jgi:hypothetical protein
LSGEIAARNTAFSLAVLHALRHYALEHQTSASEQHSFKDSSTSLPIFKAFKSISPEVGSHVRPVLRLCRIWIYFQFSFGDDSVSLNSLVALLTSSDTNLRSHGLPGEIIDVLNDHEFATCHGLSTNELGGYLLAYQDMFGKPLNGKQLIQVNSTQKQPSDTLEQSNLSL